MDGLLGLVDEVLLDERGELSDDGGLIPRVHREIGVLPLAHDAESLELFALDRDEALRVAAAFAPEIEGAHLGLLGAETAIDLQLDRQAVAIPARQVGRVEPGHRSTANHDVLEDLVEAGPQVEMAVCVGRTIVKDEALLSATGLPDLGVEALLLPRLQAQRLLLRQAGLHLEGRLREVQCRLQIDRLGGHRCPLRRMTGGRASPDVGQTIRLSPALGSANTVSHRESEVDFTLRRWGGRARCARPPPPPIRPTDAVLRHRGAGRRGPRLPPRRPPGP